MTKEEIYKASDVLNTILDNYLHGGEAAEVVTKFEDELTKSNLTKEEPASDDFTKALAECINQSQCAVVDPMAHAETWKDELIKLAKSEEPISEELDEAAKIYARGEYDRKNPSSLPWQCKGCYSPLIYAFKDGAQWQKEQFEKNRLKHCDSITNEQAELEQGFIDQHLDKYNRMPTFLDAIEYGMRLKEKQMMAKAVDVTVHIEAGNYPYIPQIELYDYDKDIPLAKEGDKYKMVLIKED